MARSFAPISLALAAAVSLCAPLAAQAALTTFDDVADTTPAPFNSGGLHFESSYGYVWHGPGYGADNGTLSMIVGFGHSVTITRVGGGAFAVDSLDAGLSWYTALTSFDVTVDGETITLDPSFQNFSFGTLNNVTSLTIGVAPGDGYFSVDNIAWHDVPEPASAALAAMALAGLAAVRRRTVEATTA